MVDQSLLNEQIYTFGMIVKGLVEALGMVAENQAREREGKGMAYTEDDFLKVIEDNGIHHNAIIDRLYQRGR